MYETRSKDGENILTNVILIQKTTELAIYRKYGTEKSLSANLFNKQKKREICFMHG